MGVAWSQGRVLSGRGVWGEASHGVGVDEGWQEVGVERRVEGRVAHVGSSW